MWQYFDTKNYIQIKKIVFFLDMKLDFFMLPSSENNYRLHCDHKLIIVHKLTCLKSITAETSVVVYKTQCGVN